MSLTEEERLSKEREDAERAEREKAEAEERKRLEAEVSASYYILADFHKL